jgi:hypothetical protein
MRLLLREVLCEVIPIMRDCIDATVVANLGF